MVISIEAHKIAYMALPKAACSSVKAALGQIDPALQGRDLAQITHKDWHNIYQTRRFRVHRWKPYQADDWFSFCVVRDPFKRLMACYTNRVLQMGDLQRPMAKTKDGRELPKEPDADFFFQNIERYREVNSSIKHHSLGAHLFLGPAPLRYTKVYKTSEIGQLARDLSERAGRDVAMPHENSSDLKLAPGDLSQETRDAIRPFLRAQYEYLAGYYKNPL